MLVQQEIKLRLPDKFAIVFDGWTEGTTTDHYIGIWASYKNTLDNCNKDEYGRGSTKETPVQSLLS